MSSLKERFDKVYNNNKEIAKMLVDKKVFGVGIDVVDGIEELWINEQCDGYYDMELTKDICVKLSKYFSDLSSILE